MTASTSRAYKLALSTGDPFTFASSDGGLTPPPAADHAFRMGEAERYCFVIDFAKYEIGQAIRRG